jgi:hypothetical protein
MYPVEDPVNSRKTRLQNTNDIGIRCNAISYTVDDTRRTLCRKAAAQTLWRARLDEYV